MQATLNKMENLFESPKDIKAETETVIDNSVMGIKTPLDTISIALQDGKESNQKDPSGRKDSITLPLNKGKAKMSTLQDLEFKNFIKTLIGIAKVYKTHFMTKPRLLKEDWEQYIAYITAQQAKRGYLRFKKAKTKEKTPREKWQQELDKEELEYLNNSQFV